MRHAIHQPLHRTPPAATVSDDAVCGKPALSIGSRERQLHPLHGLVPQPLRLSPDELSAGSVRNRCYSCVVGSVSLSPQLCNGDTTLAGKHSHMMYSTRLRSSTPGTAAI
jgi:hypothetical protein